MKRREKQPCRLFFVCHNHYKSTVVLPVCRVNVGPQSEGLPHGSASVRAEKLSILLLQLKKSPSINDECQTQHDVWPGKQTSTLCRFMVTAGQETSSGMVETQREETRGCEEDAAANVTSSLSTLLGMWWWIFKMQQQLSFPKPSADIWDFGQPALLQHRKRNEGQRCSLSAKGTVEGMG